MRTLTQKGQEHVRQLAQKYQISESAVLAMLQAVNNGGGSMAQFNIPELGGGGQWMRGGMTMVGDMFNSGLQYKVSNLCGDLSMILSSEQIFEPLPAPTYSNGSISQNQNGSMSSGSWWPSEFGSPSSSGGQNNMRYAYFPSAKRLVVETNGHQTVYDTLHHNVSGVSQQQNGNGYNLQFSSQQGYVDLTTLPIIRPDHQMSQEVHEPKQENKAVNQSFSEPDSAQSGHLSPSSSNHPSQSTSPPQEDDIINTLEKLAGLVKKNIISDEEFQTKKKELLSRL